MILEDLEETDLNLIDLFCGTGGFSLGARKAGFKVSVSYDIDPILTSSYSANFPNTNLKLQDVSKLTADQIMLEADSEIDGVIGGPPCQGFSSIGKRSADDSRRKLLWHFFRIVKEVRPKFFVMENVKGLTYSGAIEELNQALRLIESEYQISENMILNAADFGAPTNRERLFIIGFRNDIGVHVNFSDFESVKQPPVSVGDAIIDLLDSRLISDEKDGFDFWQIQPQNSCSSFARRMHGPSKQFTGNRLTRHGETIKKRFAQIAQGEHDKVGRHPRLSLSGQCPTLRAGTGADRGSHQAVRPIHPTIDRVITVREAARLQGFPDSHLFHPTIWHSFRMIGNSVSPIMSEAIFKLIYQKFGVSSS